MYEFTLELVKTTGIMLILKIPDNFSYGIND